ncbi:MAG: filamentous hemagglutinin N-terminal domain-containing protein, partial [Paraburkholderia graminis]
MSRDMFSMRPPRASGNLPAVPVSISLSLFALFIGMSCAAPVLAQGTLPQGGAYVSGSGSIASAGNTLTVTQPGSTRGVVNWNSFSIGGNNTVVFNNGSGATLNRVTGGSPSSILGKLNATGSVYLINPQGVVVGPQGVVTTGGRFVASTLDTDNASFMSGGALTFSGQSDQRVVNLGHIGSTNGD